MCGVMGGGGGGGELMKREKFDQSDSVCYFCTLLLQILPSRFVTVLINAALTKCSVNIRVWSLFTLVFEIRMFALHS